MFLRFEDPAGHFERWKMSLLKKKGANSSMSVHRAIEEASLKRQSRERSKSVDSFFR